MAMPRNKSPGPDKISMGVIKDCLPVILGPLTNLINSSLMLGKYDDHISKLSSTCINKLCQISRVKESFVKKTLISLIEALVINKLLYCSSVWANTSSKILKKLQTVQNFACRIITSIKKFDHVTPGLQELNWLSIENLLIYNDL